MVETGRFARRARDTVTHRSGRHDRLHWRAPFHFARLNNQVVSATSEDLVLFLNDDTEALEPGWLEHMAALALRADVGVVGALLLYADGTIQHAGVSVDCDPPTHHVWQGFPFEEWKRVAGFQAPFETAAVTGAALMCRRDVFTALGGFCERFSLAYNDIDLCLRVRRAGWRCMVHPEVRLVHHESQTRGRFHKPNEESLFLRKWWRTLAAGDPFYRKWQRDGIV